jgi:hypothetical protein
MEPQNTAIAEHWSTLLKAVQLEGITDKPIIHCHTSENSRFNLLKFASKNILLIN